MSEELFPVPVGAQAPAVQLSPEEIAGVQAELARAIAAADGARARIRELVGPQPGKMAQDMLTKINQGTGFLRECHDSIEGMFKKWAKCRLQMACPHDHGFNPRGHYYFCKRCDLQFSREANGTMVPWEVQL
ncbi:hypothetical protein CfE428DRAFT_5835 [Chthoniobacter flavus Ellin428]|uniref:Uncharacterized protein n=1 Tax=Chthoniobacter flavus Ellin428 TaxID=497964 RepID=B4DA95_9BACT|nr:hypothetical protein [Chthoniobacter flavus]EDY16722.1 hypothetical protein CfE428DRAFT_5835 [Chthoniobacter flavus Ellin428]TCO87287.1 hypothetical protein EV701_123124 [Chthoniobacter flavus]